MRPPLLHGGRAVSLAFRLKRELERDWDFQPVFDRDTGTMHSKVERYLNLVEAFHRVMERGVISRNEYELARLYYGGDCSHSALARSNNGNVEQLYRFVWDVMLRAADAMVLIVDGR